MYSPFTDVVNDERVVAATTIGVVVLVSSVVEFLVPLSRPSYLNAVLSHSSVFGFVLLIVSKISALPSSLVDVLTV